MLISESQVKAIIKEEIQKMVEEGEIDESWFSDTLRSVGKKAAGAAARMSGFSPEDLVAQQKADAAAQSKKEKTAAGVAKIEKKGELGKTYSSFTAQLGKMQQTIETLADMTSEKETSEIRNAADKLQAAIEKTQKQTMGYQFEEVQTEETE